MGKQLTVAILFRSSRGFFKTREEAEKKKNREEQNDRGVFVQLEPVIEVTALVVTDDDDGDEYFFLNPIKVEDLLEIQAPDRAFDRIVKKPR